MFSTPAMPPVGYCTTNGVKSIVIEMTWETAEPSDNQWNTSYFDGLRAKYGAYKAAGCSISLNYGLHHPPTWMETQPNAKFVDQDNNTYTGTDELDLISNTALRTQAEQYTLHVFQEFGPNRDFRFTRVGGIKFGELGYPPADRAGVDLDSYWDFNAAATGNPVPGWKPCQSSPNGEAAKFLEWHWQRAEDFMLWQVQSVLAARQNPSVYADPGRVAPLMAGNTATDTDKATAAATNLCGTSTPERDGKVPRAFIHGRYADKLAAAGYTGGDVAIWATWGNNPTPTLFNDSKADQHNFPFAAENSGPGDSTKAQPFEDNCRAASDVSGATCYWIRYGEAEGSFLTAISTNP